MIGSRSSDTIAQRNRRNVRKNTGIELQPIFEIFSMRESKSLKEI